MKSQLNRGSTQQDRIIALEGQMSALLFSWIYIGIFRMYLLPQYSNQLYFVSYAILVWQTFYFITYLRASSGSFPIMFAVNFFGFVFQILHTIYGNTSILTCIYGYCLYILPINLIFMASVLKESGYFDKFVRAIVFSAFPNLILCILQTSLPNSSFARGFSETHVVTSSQGYARAFGTFTSPAGFSVYLGVLTAITLCFYKPRSRMRVGLLYGAVSLLYLFSGSRQVYFNLAIILVVYFASSKKGFLVPLLKSFIPLIALGVLSVFLIRRFGVGTFDALLERFSQAGRSENTLDRINGILFGFFSNLNTDLFGSGMGSRSIGTTGYTNTSQWIENDTSKSIFELGPFFGLAWIGIRYGLFLFFVTQFLIKRLQGPSVLFAAVGFVLIAGQISSQSTISLGCWLVIQLLFLLNRRPVLTSRAI